MNGSSFFSIPFRLTSEAESPGLNCFKVFTLPFSAFMITARSKSTQSADCFTISSAASSNGTLKLMSSISIDRYLKSLFECSRLDMSSSFLRTCSVLTDSSLVRLQYIVRLSETALVCLSKSASSVLPVNRKSTSRTFPAESLTARALYFPGPFEDMSFTSDTS